MLHLKDNSLGQTNLAIIIMHGMLTNIINIIAHCVLDVSSLTALKDKSHEQPKSNVAFVTKLDHPRWARVSIVLQPNVTYVMYMYT